MKRTLPGVSAKALGHSTGAISTWAGNGAVTGPAGAQLRRTLPSPRNLVVDGEETETPFIIDDFWNLDLQYSYVFNDLKGATLRLGCRN